MSGKSGHTLRLIEHLVYLKFPGLEIADDVFADDPNSLTELKEQVEAYKARLSGLSDEDLEMEAEMAEVAALLADEQYLSSREDLKRFFNLFGAKADYRPWGLVASWTLDQATALALGKEPTAVTWKRVKEFVDVSNFARRYGQLRAFLKAEPLTFPISPPEFVAWAKRRELSLPDDLIAAVQQPKEEPVQPGEPLRVFAQPMKPGRPPILPDVKAAVLELYDGAIPERASESVLQKVELKLREQGKTCSPVSLRKALRELRGDLNRQK